MSNKSKYSFERWDAIRSGDPGILISPSLLAANLVRIEDEVRAIAEEADLLHFDVMDGTYVPNISYGMPVLEAIDKLDLLPNDVHLMIDDASRYITDFAEAGADSGLPVQNLCCRTQRIRQQEYRRRQRQYHSHSSDRHRHQPQ